MLRLALPVVTLAFTACFGTVQLPAPPADADLVNDGTRADQTRVYQRYAVALTPSHVGIGEAVYSRNWLPGYVGFPPPMNAYLASDDEAGRTLPPVWKSALPLSGVVTIPLALLVGLTLSAPFTVVQFSILAVGMSGGLAPVGDALRTLPAPVLVAVLAAVALSWFLALAVALFVDWALAASALGVTGALAWWAIHDEQNAVDRFNQNLWKRVQRNARK